MERIGSCGSFLKQPNVHNNDKDRGALVSVVFFSKLLWFVHEPLPKDITNVGSSLGIITQQ